MAIPKRKSLAGTCGIPRERERVYVKVLDKAGSDVGLRSGQVPKKIVVPGSAPWDVDAVSREREFGRELFGNLCVRFAVTVRGMRKTLWWEHGDWFVSEDEVRPLGTRPDSQP